MSYYPKARTIADALAAGHLSYNGDRSSKTAKARYRRLLYRLWGLSAHRGWAHLILDRRGLVQAPNVPRDPLNNPAQKTLTTKRPHTAPT